MTMTVLFDELGGPEVLRLADLDAGEPGPGEVRIRVDAIGLNRAEALFRSGTYVYPPSLPGSRLGYEAAGVIEAVGDDVEGFSVGDAVSAVPTFLMTEYGTYAESVVLPAHALIHRPEAVDAVIGAATWMSYTTAYGLLVEYGDIKPGDTVLINAASSGVGLAAIQVANHLGAVPVATTRTSAKAQRLLDAGAAHVIATEEQDLVKEVLAVTDGRGVELALDAVMGPAVNTLVQAVVPDGALLFYGWLDTTPAPMPIAPDFRGRTLRTYAFTELTIESKPRLRRATHFINAGLRSGSLAPVIDETFALADVVAAHRYLESNAQFGKIVLTVDH
ncbi:NADPH:quinone reductase-like Zn-dependent oxidoreductase [Kribbella sp. VKM Ac-2571]|uniref:zinc-dependent alcohol dehydrogenase family protein n=1 Tax=Kribbella sp. VKM Ac-2571 TaxID=2512222 RepID=UPI00105F8975|nr:zinc-dependent alcohol dehydrogenase family protein [Kribbella sp. VKM Ac-2571]TDO66500.1 NADPH:quinone reductase-like Zn-dependent oxidoreductase [Kribbella sp. VKM Ac-2571]